MENQLYYQSQNNIDTKVKVEIIGKYSCIYCRKAIELANKNNFELLFINCLQFPKHRQFYIDKYQHKTVPIVLVNGLYIGGYSDFERCTKNILSKFPMKNRDVKNPEIQTDSRTEQEIQLNMREMENLTQQNYEKFSIELTTKNSIPLNGDINQQQQKLLDKKFYKSISQVNRQKEAENEKKAWFGQKKTMEFEDDGNYITYYDNYVENNNYYFKLPLVIVNGYPSYIFEWEKFQQQFGYDTIRIIHIIQPGMDGKDERRGKAKGYMLENACLMKKLLDKLKISKVILASHSFGTYLASEFTQLFPYQVASSITIGGPGIQLHNLGSYLITKGYNRLNVNYEDIQRQREQIYHMLNSDDFRNNVLSKQFSDAPNGEQEKNEYFAYLKYITSYCDGINGVFENYRNKPKVLSFIAHGSEDNFIDPEMGCLGMKYFFFYGKKQIYSVELSLKKLVIVYIEEDGKSYMFPYFFITLSEALNQIDVQQASL